MFFDLLLDRAILVFPILVFGGHDIDQGAGASSCSSCPKDMVSAAGSTSEDGCAYGKKSTIFHYKHTVMRRNKTKLRFIEFHLGSTIVVIFLDYHLSRVWTLVLLPMLNADCL